MLEWHGWNLDRAVGAFMIGDFNPPRSYRPGGANDPTEVGDGLPHPLGGVDPPGIGVLGGRAAGVDVDVRGGGSGGRGESRAPPRALSVIVGLPFRLLGKVRLLVWYDDTVAARVGAQ